LPELSPTIPPTNNYEETRYLNNSHKMFPGKTFEYDGFECGKTGFTDQALNTLVTVAKRGDVELICVTLHGNQTHYPDTATLLNYGFANYKNLIIGDSDENLKGDYYINKYSELGDFINGAKSYEMTYDTGARLIFPTTGSFADLTQKLTGVNVDGTTLNAMLEYYYGEDYMGSLPLTIKKEETPLATVAGFAEEHPILFNIIRVVLIILGVLLVGYICLYIYAVRRRKKRRGRNRNHNDR